MFYKAMICIFCMGVALSHVTGRMQTDSVGVLGAEENIWNKKGESSTRLSGFPNFQTLDCRNFALLAYHRPSFNYPACDVSF